VYCCLDGEKNKTKTKQEKRKIEKREGNKNSKPMKI